MIRRDILGDGLALVGVVMVFGAVWTVQPVLAVLVAGLLLFGLGIWLNRPETGG